MLNELMSWENVMGFGWVSLPSREKGIPSWFTRRLQDELSFFTDIGNFNEWDNNVNEQIMSFEADLIRKKSKKIERDRLDCLQGREFNWESQYRTNITQTYATPTWESGGGRAARVSIPEGEQQLLKGGKHWPRVNNNKPSNDLHHPARPINNGNYPHNRSIHKAKKHVSKTPKQDDKYQYNNPKSGKGKIQSYGNHNSGRPAPPTRRAGGASSCRRTKNLKYYWIQP